jgi:hypothetical protein
MRRMIPVAILFLLAPLVGEVLLGATPVTKLGGLLPLSAVYGGGAVLIRELARRRRAGWPGILFLGAAYAIVEEGFAVQSFFNPALFHAAEIGGRAFGVNWVWTEWTIGYHIVWSIGIPILLTEVLCPDVRDVPWLRGRGIVAMGLLYCAGVAAIAAIFRKIVTPDFHAPVAPMAGAALACAALIAAGLVRRPDLRGGDDRGHPGRVPPAWLLVPMSGIAAALWFRLLALPDSIRHGRLAILAIVLAAAALALLFRAIGTWMRRAGWTDVNTLALTSGPLAVSAAFGFFEVTAGNRVDQIGQGCISAIACVLLVWLAAHLRRRRARGSLRSQPDVADGGDAHQTLRQALP